MDIRKYCLPKKYFLRLFSHKDFIRSTENLKKNTFLDFKLIRITTSIGAKSSFSRPAVVKVVDQLELFNHSLHLLKG